MNPDRERMMRAYFEVYFDFYRIYQGERKGAFEAAILFQTAWNDNMLGHILQEELIEKYTELKSEVAKEEEESEEAMII